MEFNFGFCHRFGGAGLPCTCDGSCCEDSFGFNEELGGGGGLLI